MFGFGKRPQSMSPEEFANRVAAGEEAIVGKIEEEDLRRLRTAVPPGERLLSALGPLQSVVIPGVVADNQDRLAVTDRSVIVMKKNQGMLGTGTTVKTIPMHGITSSSIYEGNRHHVRFEYAGAPSSGGAKLSILDSIGIAKAENIFLFGEDLRPYVETVLRLIRPSGPSPTPTSGGPEAGPHAADRLRKIKGLLDDGVITQAEFDAKKAKLMDEL